MRRSKGAPHFLVWRPGRPHFDCLPAQSRCLNWAVERVETDAHKGNAFDLRPQENSRPDRLQVSSDTSTRRAGHDPSDPGPDRCRNSVPNHAQLNSRRGRRVVPRASGPPQLRPTRLPGVDDEECPDRGRLRRRNTRLGRAHGYVCGDSRGISFPRYLCSLRAKLPSTPCLGL